MKITANQPDFHKLRLLDVMTRSIITIDQSRIHNVYDVLEQLRQHHIRHLPVVSAGEVVGVLTLQAIRAVLPADLLKLRRVREAMRSAVIAIAPTDSLWKLRYEAADRASGQMLYERDLTSDRVTWGCNTEQILGFASEEMPQDADAFMMLVHPDDFEWINAADYRAKQSNRREYQIRRKDDTYIWVADCYQRIGSDRIIGFLINITDRKQAEANLQRTEQWLQQFSRLSPSLIYTLVCEADGRCIC
ncbi:PAS domain-containing protein [Microcoleus sp. FACHB-1515]|uniref:CBS domain-containing protein n=1 Tax=Cyanophyceae TaxID=3028117 RepID=UPI0016882631|nr:CBS domain-containing protein [Microcoleus sp. FACHB-1515]MBD2091884.1 PAS domain-containing protein [Microcoleus sp. FACHB-1515]